MMRAAAVLCSVVCAAFGAVSAARAQGVRPPSGTDDARLVAGLAAGGHVIVMRHASSPRTPPSSDIANPDNRGRERQLDADGRKGAAVMGAAIRALRIPIAEVLVSPTYRARETVREATLAPVTAVEELGDGGQTMQGVATDAQVRWLREHAAQAPGAGNVLLVTHQQNIAGAFPDWGMNVGEGESLVFRPDGLGGAALVARIAITDWPRLANAGQPAP